MEYKGQSQREKEDHGLGLRDSGAFSCAVCQSGVDVNSIQCSKCRLWVHKKCSGVKGRLVEDPDYVQDA